MKDTIYREDAIDRFCKQCNLVSEYAEPCTEKCNNIKILEMMPSALPEHSGGLYVDGYDDGYRDGWKEGRESLRQEAIKAVDDLPNCYNGFSDTYDKAYIIGVLEELPPAQPDLQPTCNLLATGLKEEVARIMAMNQDTPIILLNDEQPEIIRCKDCKYSDENWRRVSVRWLPCMDMRTGSNWFCGSAERRTDDEG